MPNTYDLLKDLNKYSINVHFSLESAQSNTSWFCLNANLCKIKQNTTVNPTVNYFAFGFRRELESSGD